MRLIFLSFILCSFTLSAKNPVVLLSIDGFSNKYLTEYKPKHILEMAKHGSKAKSLLPVFPTKTFPNHLSIVTGVYPAKHGIIHNTFYNRVTQKKYTKGAAKTDNTWLKYPPIWSVAEKNGLKTAIYYWPESEVEMLGQVASYNYAYNSSTPNNERLDQIVRWLNLPKIARPQFIAAYFSSVDSAGHSFGPNSEELKKAVNDIDKDIGVFLHRLKKEVSEPVDIILVSDHGMTKSQGKNAIDWTTLIDEENNKIINGETQLFLYAKDLFSIKDTRSHLLANRVKKGEKRYTVEVKGQFPKHWHFNHDSPVIPDLIINALPPYTFIDTDGYSNQATHGYAPDSTSDLAGIFIAQGPSFKRGVIIDSLENINVFPMLLKLLELKSPSQIDGVITPLMPILKSDNTH